jgi:hypothetical protein
MAEINRNMKEKKGIVNDAFVKRVSQDGRKAKAVTDQAAPGVRINRENLKKEPRSKNVVDMTSMSASQKSQYDTESRINQYVNRSVHRVRKSDRGDSY